MTDTNNHFFSSNKIQNHVIQFGFRIPARRELLANERKALEGVLKELNNEFFQLFDDPQQKIQGSLFQSLRQVLIGATTATVPAFNLSNDSFTFFYPIKLMGQSIKEIGMVDASNVNPDMISWFNRVQQVISNSSCKRTGKIYELVLGPFAPEEKKQIFNELFVLPLDKIGELGFTFAEYALNNDELYNIQTTIQYQQLKIEDPFNVAIRVDINNRLLVDRMDPRDVKKVWDFADNKIDNHLKSIINLQGGIQP